ncbi:PilZ domain-containing protein [Saccharospirillum impatiens]|uniref:PilZ domain-containing protein n=1 Tax=Saccharospirillum impatiens TaxID=169438 RepID=UPI00040FB918|nr:PilZ domain-containing protein [Saccharospirillum impatiens]
MSQDQRGYPRTRFEVTIELVTRNGYRTEAKTWNISDGGTFVELTPAQKQHFNLGTQVHSQVQGLPMPAPVVLMRVVRHAPSGIGLKIIDS